ncbi:MAG: tRNA (adenosine(37)-N6)-dimethylallyltransferase MiaA [Algoriphagus sp.]
MIKNQRFLVLVVGPTAVGKSELCLNLAKKFQTEIVSCDSRQFYRELHLGTAKPSPEEMEEVPHHFIDSLSIEDAYDVRKFEQEALLVLDRLFASHEVVVMVGGSGLFAQAIEYGLDEIPNADAQMRKEIITSYEVMGLEWLQSEVERVDPEFFDKVDRNNPQRLVRALEVFRCSGLKFSSFRIKNKVHRPFQTLKIGLDLPREELYHRIDQRMENMLSRGLFEEARSLFDKRHLNALQTLGYTEIFGFLEGKYDKEEMFRLLKRNSRRYAKRQLTWFRKDNQITWFHPSQEEDILHYLISQMA